MLTPITYLHNTASAVDVDWASGVFLPVNKPFEWTSFDVVNKIRYQLKHLTGQRKFKVGHAGTLDPRATGLLLIACGKATKQIESLTSHEKSYSGVIQLGATTPTLDGEMEPDHYFPTDHITSQAVAQAEQFFIGEIEQEPPVFSAIKKDGKRLYKYARKGQEVDIPLRRIEIKHLSLRLNDQAQITFDCTCSKGTYIRSLARDIGQHLGSGGYLSELVRTSIGEYSLGDAWELEDLIEVLSSQMNSTHVD